MQIKQKNCTYPKFCRISSLFNTHIALIFIREELLCNAHRIHNHFVDTFDKYNIIIIQTITRKSEICSIGSKIHS